jgi:hypothetical protein
MWVGTAQVHGEGAEEDSNLFHLQPTPTSGGHFALMRMYSGDVPRHLLLAEGAGVEAARVHDRDSRPLWRILTAVFSSVVQQGASCMLRVFPHTAAGGLATAVLVLL